MRTVAPFAAFAVGLCLLLSSCLRFGYDRSRFEPPVPEELLDRMVPGEADLGDCLRALGAPHIVQEHRSHGMTLAWGWIDEDGFSGAVSYNFNRLVPSASFSVDLAGRDVPGAVLFFDEELRLELIRRGSLRDILPRRRPPATIDQIEKTEGDADSAR